MRSGRVATSLAVLALLAVPASSSAATYYVDNGSASCSPSGPGTEAQPYCTISAAVAAHNGPGVTILVKPGTYREQVTVPGSGVSGNPFVIQALGSPVLVDGSDDFSSPGLWTLLSGNVYRAASVTWSPLQVFKDGARLTVSTAAPASLPSNSFEWVSGQGLYVNVGGGNPGSHALLVGRRSYGFQLVGRTWITLSGFQVSHTESRGIYLNNSCSDLTISRDTVSFANSYGIQNVGALRNIIEYCRTSDNNLHGIGLTQNTQDCIARFNESMRNADPAVRRANGIYLNASPDNSLYGNRLHDNQDTGIHFSGGSNDCVAWDNRSWNNGDHGYDHLDASGTHHIHDVAFGNYKDGFSIEGSSPNTHVFNCIAINNGLTTDEFDIWVNNTSSVGFVSDYNILWNSTSQAPFKFITTTYTTIAAYHAASDQDAHSLQVDPRFVNGPGGDFHLQPGSPAIDAANSGVPEWPAVDAEGNARVDDPATANTGAGSPPYADRGALEYQPSIDHPPVVLAPATASGPENALLTVDVTAADPDGDPIGSLTAVGLPAGATFTPGPGNTSGTFSWTPDFSQAGSYAVAFVASNALSATDTTVITVTNVDRAPLVTAPAAASVQENAPITVNVTASDPDGDPIESLTAVGLPGGATFTAGPGNTGGTFNWTPDFTQSGIYLVSFVAANALAGAYTTEITVGGSDRAPIVQAPATAGGAENGLLAFTVTARDPDGDPIDSLTAAGLPPGATFTPGPGDTSGTFSWTPDFSQAGSYQVSFIAANALWGADTTAVTITNTDRAPVLVAPAAASVAESDSMSMAVTAHDPDGEPIDSLTVVDLPAGATFTADPGDTSGTFRWQPSVGQAGAHPVSFRAGNALVVTDTTVITVTTAVTGVWAGPAHGPPLVPRVAPDPFRDRAHLRFAITREGPLRVQVFDIAGRVVRTVVDESHAAAGEYDVSLEVWGNQGRLAQGLYFYRIQAAEGSARGRFLVLR